MSKKNGYRRPTYSLLSLLLLMLIYEASSISQERLQSINNPFLDAIASNDISKIDALLKDNKNAINEPNSQGEAGLHLAAKCGHVKMLTFLLKNGAAVNLKDSYGQIPLHIVLTKDDCPREIAEMLINAGSDVNEPNKDGLTPLALASANQNTDIVKLLIKAGADVNPKSFMGFTPLIGAISRCDVETVKLLIRTKANPNISSALIPCGEGVATEGVTPLLLAAGGCDAELVKLLLKAGADAKVTDKEGNNALHYSARGKNSEVVPLLIRAGTLINQKNNHGNTPLHLAIKEDSPEGKTVSALMINGADANLKDSWGKTSLDIAREMGRNKILLILESHLE